MASQEVTLRQAQDPGQAAVTAEQLVWATPTPQHLGSVYKFSYVASQPSILRRILLLLHAHKQV